MSNKEDEDRVSVGSESTVRCVPTPSWVKYEPWPPEEEQSPGACSDNGLLRVLFDCQISLLQPGVARHVRAVQRILTRAGAEGAAHVTLEFDPAHERLEVHCIRVCRGEQRIEHARPSDFQILRRETRLERLALDGRLTATLLIPDLRIDDRLEIAFTVSGRNPILSGRHGSWIVFNAYAPWIETRQRLIRPVRRPVFLKAFNDPPEAHVLTREDIEESAWSIRGQERKPLEDLLPLWSVKNTCYQITEFEQWGEVSRLFEKYYRDNALPAELVAELDRLASEHPDESERAVEWLRMVQRQLRYFALALGEGGLVPRSLPEIWTRRFGDCKDAARLYVAGARYLGLDASAALVSTIHGLSLVDFLPSPQVFNHVVVCVRAGGATYWLDPTLQPQGGSLAHIAPLHAGWALPLTPDTTELERLPSLQPLQHIHCEDTIQFGPKVESPAVLDRRIDFAFWTADAVRNRIEGEGLSRVSAQLLGDLRMTWPDAVERSPLQVQDDSNNNRLSVSCTYEIPNCWKGGDRHGRVGFNIADPFVGKELAPLKDTRRKGEIVLGRPRKTTWRARLQMPCDWQGTGWRHVLDDAGIRFTSELTIEGAGVVFRREVEIGAWSVTPDKAGAYAEIAEKMRQNAVTLWAREGFDGTILPAAAAQRGSRRYRWAEVWAPEGVDGTILPAAVAQRGSRGYRWAALLFIVPLLVALSSLTSRHTDFDSSPVATPLVTPGGDLLDRGSHSSFVTAPEAHLNRFERAIDGSLEHCIAAGRDSKGPYLLSSCSVEAKIGVARPSGGRPLEVTLSPGEKSYVYLLELFDSDAPGAFAACPSSDQIVAARTGLPWTVRGTSYECQHSLR